MKKVPNKVFKGFLSCFKVKKDILSARDILSAPTVDWFGLTRLIGLVRVSLETIDRLVWLNKTDWNSESVP